MAKDVADISGRLAIPRYTARAFDCTWTGIVGRDSEVNHAEPVEHLPQIPRRAEDIGHGVKAIEDAEFLCRCWHQLAKARSACRADSKGVVEGLCPDECIEQAGGQRIFRLRRIDVGQVARPPKPGWAGLGVVSVRQVNSSIFRNA